jgi:leucyl aminopeptidase
MTALPSFTVADAFSRELCVSANDYSEKYVVVTSTNGPMRLQMNFDAEGARSLADALHACANSLEMEVMEVSP